MFARCGKFLVIAALVLATGAHWAALQTVAWTAMLANNLCTQSVSEAVSNTFDGAHPCPMCKAIAAGKKSEQKSAAVSPPLKMEFPPAAEKLVLVSPARFSWLPSVEFSAAAAFARPPVPPPRGRFV